MDDERAGLLQAIRDAGGDNAAVWYADASLETLRSVLAKIRQAAELRLARGPLADKWSDLSADRHDV